MKKKLIITLVVAILLATAGYFCNKIQNEYSNNEQIHRNSSTSD